MKLILHIGSPKAGSTAIQEGLAASRDSLSEQGITYFDGDRAYSTLYQKMHTMPPVMAARFDTIQKAEQWSESRWQYLEATLTETRPEVAVMSSEHFLNLPVLPNFLGRLSQTFDDIRAVAYMRDPVSSFNSDVNQRIRGGARLRDIFSPWETAHPMWQADAIGRWDECLGKDNLTVRNLDRKNLVGGDAVADFMSILSGLSGRNVSAPEAEISANESLSGASSAWLLMLNETLPKKLSGPAQKAVAKLRRRTVQKLRAVDERTGAPGLKLRDEVIISYIRHMTRDGCEMLNTRYFQDQRPLELGPHLETVPDKRELRARLRDWIMASLEPEHLAEIAREVSVLEGPDS